MRTTLLAAGKVAVHHHALFDGFTWAEGATIIAAVLAAVFAVIGYTIQRKITRRSERADLYGNATGAVEAYLEGPYRIRRKTADSDNWFAISSALSDAKTAISHHQALLEMHAPAQVFTAYREFASAAIIEAGPQMTAAWGTPPISAPTDVPLGTGYDRSDSDAKRSAMVTAMAADLTAIGSWWRFWR
jgi:hypothetical protein